MIFNKLYTNGEIAGKSVGLEEMKNQAGRDLYKFLKGHETDIAWGINDFGHLRVLFEVVMEREAKK